MSAQHNMPAITVELVDQLIALQRERCMLAQNQLQDLHAARERAAETFGAERATLACLEDYRERLAGPQLVVPS